MTVTGALRIIACAAALALGAASSAAACTIRPPDNSEAGRAEQARQARERQAALDRAEAAFTAVVGKSGGFAVPDRRLRGVPPARIELPRDTCSPFWQEGQRLVIYATRTEGRWIVVRTTPDTPEARDAVRPAPKRR